MLDAICLLSNQLLVGIYFSVYQLVISNRSVTIFHCNILYSTKIFLQNVFTMHLSFIPHLMCFYGATNCVSDYK